MVVFIGRQHELKALENLPRHKSNLVVLRGRRRIGKSRLAFEFGKNKVFLSFSGISPTKGTTTQDQLDEFARQFYSLFKKPPLTFKDWSDAFLNLTEHLTQEPTIILFDEISWMGDKDPAFIGKLKNWFDLHLQQYQNVTLILCGSVSTWIEENIINSTALFGRISLTLTLNELSLSESVEFLKALKFKGSSYDVLKILSVTGGIPWYLEQVLTDQFADDTIKYLCFVKEGLLVHEFDRIFTDLFDKRGEIYERIVRHLADGAKTVGELRLILGYEHGGVLSKYIKDLTIAGFIKTHHQWSFKTKKVGKQSLVRLSDSYLRFYLKYIDPQMEKIEKNSFQEMALSSLPGFQTIMGYQFENLLLNNRSLLLKKIGILEADIVRDNPYIQRQTKQHKGCQIDYLIQTKSNNLILCEFKFQTSNITTSIIDEMVQKVKRLSVPRGFGVSSVLIHMGPVSESVYLKDYFLKIVDVEELLI